MGNSLPAIMAPHLPPNVRVSKHPYLRAKLSQLRSKSTNARETKTLVHEIALLLGVDALSNLKVEEAGKDETPIGFEYSFEAVDCGKITLVPILRSGLGMVSTAGESSALQAVAHITSQRNPSMPIELL